MVSTWVYFLLVSSTIGWGEFFENGDFFDDFERDSPLELDERSLQDYETRESHPFEQHCEVRLTRIQVRDRDPGYDYAHYPKFNATCVAAKSNPWTYPRNKARKDFCVVFHKSKAGEKNHCETVYANIPILKSKKNDRSCWSHDTHKVGVGCKCHIAFTFD